MIIIYKHKMKADIRKNGFCTIRESGDYGFFIRHDCIEIRNGMENKYYYYKKLLKFNIFKSILNKNT